MRSAYRWLDRMSSPSSFSRRVGVPKDVPLANVADAFHHSRVGVAKNERPPRATEVDELVAVGIPNVGALSPVHKQGVRLRIETRVQESSRRRETRSQPCQKGRPRKFVGGSLPFQCELAQHEELPTLEAARDLDLADPLSRFRERFHLPQHEGKDTMYFTGNSLGLQPKAARQALEVELEDWATYGVEGHFQGRNPWVSYHERFVDGLCHLTGARAHEVVAMNGLTVNLHLLLISFYQPEGTRRKLLCEAKAFPSDRYALCSQIRLHGGNPETDLIELAPREGERFCAPKTCLPPSRTPETSCHGDDRWGELLYGRSTT